MADWYQTALTPGELDAAHHPKDEEEENEAAGGATAGPAGDPLAFIGRRSPVLFRSAGVSSSQPLATEIGVHLLRQGAKAADVAVAVAAVLAVTEPCSTGLGGDMFALHYDSSAHPDTGLVTAFNGSGRSPAALTHDLLVQLYPLATTLSTTGDHRETFASTAVIDMKQFRDSVHAITVPGAAHGWETLYKTHGSGQKDPDSADPSVTRPPHFTLGELLEPAADLAEKGFPVAPITAYHWQAGFSQITKWLPASASSSDIPLSVQGRAPQAGEVVTNPDLASVLRELGQHGAARGFYGGRAGQALVQAVQQHGGCLTRSDLTQHTTEQPTPIAVPYRHCHLWQVPPNGQGLAALVALAGLEQLEQHGHLPSLSPDTVGTADSYHALIEMMRLGLADVRAHVACPHHRADGMTGVEDLLNIPDRIGPRARQLFDRERAVIHGTPDPASCTVSFQVVDIYGNAVSFVNSNFMGFGTGLVPQKCGFTLQNRGFGFSLDPLHPNAVGPAKRPFHTIIPALLTHADTGELYATLSNMGGNMQPQGHVQLTVNLLAGKMDPQAAIDAPRFCIVDGTHNGTVYLEEGIPESVVEELRRRGHPVRAHIRGHERSIFGRAQIILRNRETGVWWAGSDGRADGCAMGF